MTRWAFEFTNEKLLRFFHSKMLFVISHYVAVKCWYGRTDRIVPVRIEERI